MMYLGIVYAIMSIGLLGFVVWSYTMMASLDCEIEFYNLAMCWNSFTLLSTFNSQNLSSYTQSAGNRKISTSSSETTRETSCFESFRALHTWLPWSIYRWLANMICRFYRRWRGALIVSKDRPYSVLTQKEGAILDHVKTVLGFGTVRHIRNGNYYRYTVEDNSNILLLCILFNGLPHRLNQLNRWINVLHVKQATSTSRIYGLWPDISLVRSLVKPTFNDAWLSGFTDAEGCFNVVVKPRPAIKSGCQIVLRFILDQNQGIEVLSDIRGLFCSGFIYLRAKTHHVYRYTHSSFINLNSVVYYFLSS